VFCIEFIHISVVRKSHIFMHHYHHRHHDMDTLCSWVYQSPDQLDGTSHSGQLGSYAGGGYVQDLAPTMEESFAQLKPLFDNLWLDRATRAVFVAWWTMVMSDDDIVVMDRAAPLVPCSSTSPSTTPTLISSASSSTPCGRSQ